MQSLNQTCTDVGRFLPPLLSICLRARINEERVFPASTFTHTQIISIWTISPFCQHLCLRRAVLTYREQLPPLLFIITCGILVASKSEIWIHLYFHLKDFSPDEDKSINTYGYNRSSEKSVIIGNSTHIIWKFFPPVLPKKFTMVLRLESSLNSFFIHFL